MPERIRPAINLSQLQAPYPRKGLAGLSCHDHIKRKGRISEVQL